MNNLLTIAVLVVVTPINASVRFIVIARLDISLIQILVVLEHWRVVEVELQAGVIAFHFVRMYSIVFSHYFKTLLIIAINYCSL